MGENRSGYDSMGSLRNYKDCKDCSIVCKVFHLDLQNRLHLYCVIDELSIFITVNIRQVWETLYGKPLL